MKKVIADIPTAMHKELKLASLELDLSMKDYICEVLYVTLLENLKHFSPEVKEKLKITDESLKDRLKKLRMSRHSG
jgi:hypothetical protein